MTQSSTTPPLMVRDVSKSFGAVAAMHGVSFPLHAGEVHAPVGENGAGKSTIVKVLAGANRPDRFQIEPDAQPVELHSPADAKAAGIAVICQEPALFPDLSLAGTSRWAGSRWLGSAPSTVLRRTARQPGCSPGSESLSSRRVQHVACSSPTSRSWRSLKPSRPRPASS